MPVPFSSALYYPSIDIKNEQWLRSAVLFWDRLRTIVPDSIREPYANPLAHELEAEGILEPVRVSSGMDEVEDLGDTVLDYLTDPATANVVFNTDDNPGGRIHPQKLPMEIRRLTDIHPEKLPYFLRSQLDRAMTDDGWYRVNPGFANFYMTLLATKLAERLGLGLVTDSGSADQLAISVHKGKPLAGIDSESGYRRRRYGHFDASDPRRTLPHEIAPGMLIDLIVEGISLPSDLAIKDLLKFKQDHREELALFRREISKLTTEIPKDAALEAMRQAVNDQYEAQVRPAMRSLRQSLSAQGWDGALNGFLKASFFSAAPTSAAILAGLPSTVALIAGAGISLTASAVLLANQRKKARIDSPYAYLLSLERRW